MHDCSLDVAPGEIVVLMGLSGSGKSTLLRAVNGLNPIVQGDVLVHDGDGLVSVPNANRATLRRLRTQTVAMVFQQFGLLPWRSVRENVGLGLELAGMGKRARHEKIDTQLELVGLTQWADQPVSALSGGMQQRVGLARAFATDAPVLLMDEPFSALDPLIRARLQDELLELQDRLKRTIIFVSHDLDEAFKLGNRIAILEGGRMIQCGTPAQIFQSPANQYVADFVANMNPLGVLRARDALVHCKCLGHADAQRSGPICPSARSWRNSTANTTCLPCRTGTQHWAGSRGHLSCRRCRPRAGSSRTGDNRHWAAPASSLSGPRVAPKGADPHRRTA